MSVNRGAFIFAGVAVVLVAIIGGVVWFSSLTNDTEQNSGQNSNDLFSSLFPFQNDSVRTPTDQNSGALSGDPKESAPKLRLVSRNRIAGAHFDAYGTIRYAERETGHFFETPARTLGITRISNTTIPGVQKIYWLSDAEFMLQFLNEKNEVRSYRASLASTTADQTLSGTFVTRYNELLPYFDGKNSVAAVSRSGGTTVESGNLSTPSAERVFSSPLTAWKILPAGEELYVQTAVSSEIGYLYRVKGGAPERVLGPLPGLSAVIHPNGNLIAYSTQQNGAYRLFTLDLVQRRGQSFVLGTYAEKCSWFKNSPLLFCGIPSGGKPATIEKWLMGMESFADDAWVLDSETGVARVVARLEPLAGSPIDIYEPAVSADGDYALFRNKNDLSLWSLNLD